MIVAAAVRINAVILTMPPPARHHDILRQISGLYDPERRPHWTYEREVQGFITHEGKFMDRRTAFAHTLECGQGQPCRRTGPTDYAGDELFSEDLW